MDKNKFKGILRSITPEVLQEANKVVVFFGNQLDDEEANKLSAEAKGVFLAALLIGYGKQQAREEMAAAPDPGEWEALTLSDFYNQIVSLASAIDAITEDYFSAGDAHKNEEALKEVEKELSAAWRHMDNAADVVKVLLQKE